MSAPAAANAKKRKIEESSKALTVPTAFKAAKTTTVAVRPPTTIFNAEKFEDFDKTDFRVDSLFVSHGKQTPEQMFFRLKHHYDAMKMTAREGKARVRNPDLAMALATSALGLKIHILEIENPSVQLQVKRTKKNYINFSFKGCKQKNFDEKTIMGMAFVTSAFVPAYGFKYGSTEETGVNGNMGKVMTKKKDGKQVPVEPGKEKYECSVGSSPICSAMEDHNMNNPMAIVYMNALVNGVESILFNKLWANPANLVARRNDLIKAKVPMPKPNEGEKAMKALIAEEKFIVRLQPNPDDPTNLTLSMSTSCYRQPHKAVEFLNIQAEDISDYEPPSAMFEANRTKIVPVDGKSITVPVIWNEIPVWRWRRPNEIKKGEHYRTPWIRIPRENVRLTNQDVIYALVDIGFYEDELDACAFKHKPIAYMWLNTVEGFNALDYANLKPCNPLVANPCAGYYKGPLGYEGEPPAEAGEEEESKEEKGEEEEEMKDEEEPEEEQPDEESAEADEDEDEEQKMVDSIEEDEDE